MKGKYPTTSEIVYLLGMGALLVAGVVAPGALYVAKVVMELKEESEMRKAQKEWKKFNPYLLKRNLKRLREQKVVEIVKENGQELIKLTEKGHTKFLRFKIEKLSAKAKWDGKWRIVIYDVVKFKKAQRERFRTLIKGMNLLQLQKSVYITPYPCDEQISFLREYLGIGTEVIYIRADRIENESVYRDYFGI